MPMPPDRKFGERMPEVMISGMEGRLEGRYSHSKQPNAPVALLLHPDPRCGGTMNNRVVLTMYQTFVKRGFSVLRINFRGVGKSQGSYGEGEGELADAATALDWLQDINPSASAAWIGGFSFGAWIGMQLLMRRPEIHRFVVVAPPADMYDFGFLAPCPCSGLILQGDADTTINPNSVEKLAERLTAQRGLSIEYNTIDGANHYFADHLEPLSEKVGNYIDSNMGRAFAAD